MGFGLILSGIGKGIADAGSTYGSMSFKAAESELADQRALQKAQALEQFKEQLKEDAERRDAAKAVEVDSRATQIGQTRATRQLDSESGKLAENAGKIAGDSPAMSQEEMRAHLASLSPQQRNMIAQTGLVDRAMTRNESRLQGSEDQVQAARELGASSTLLKSYQETKKSVLEEIKQENTARRDDQRHTETMAQQDRLGKQSEATTRIAQQNADANTTRANKPTGTDPNKPATTADLQRQITASQNSLATELGVPKNDVNSEVASIKKKAAAGNPQAKATLERIQPFLDEYSDANSRMLQFKRSSPSTKDSGDNSGKGESSASSSAVSKPTTQAQFDAIPSGALYVNPKDGLTYRKK